MNESPRTVLFVAWPQFNPTQIAFWRRLRDRLRDEGLHLVMASTSQAPADFGVPHIGIPPLDAFWPVGRAGAAPTVETFGLDADFLLEREHVVNGPTVLPAFRECRRRGLDATVDYWLRAIAAIEPAAVVIANGQRVAELILAAICRAYAIPTLYVERAPIPQAWFVDDQGLSVASTIAQQASWPTPGAEWHARAAAVTRRIVAEAQTGWEQPLSRDADRQSLRRQLDIPPQSLVLMFAGQVEEDVQQYLFSPHFESNAAAFAWFLQHLRGRDDVYVLGKQHPKNPNGAMYRRALADSGVAGVWRDDVSIDDALVVADRVVAVNSTVLYEALARELPVLSLGEWLLSGRGAAYEVRDLARGREVVDAWLTAADTAAQQSVWQDRLAFLLSSCIYAVVPGAEALGLHGLADLAARIRRKADDSPRQAMPFEHRVAGFVHQTWAATNAQAHDVEQARHVFGLRTQLLGAARAARRGQRVVIWGTGAAGRLAAAIVEREGGIVDAFTSSAPAGPRFEGRPLISPDALRQDDVLLIATMAAADIVPSLTARGLVRGTDFHILDCHLLAEQAEQPSVAVRIA